MDCYGQNSFTEHPLRSLAEAFNSFVLHLVILLAGFILSTSVVFAGVYHDMDNDTIMCSQCHTMHNSQGGESMVYPDQGVGSQEMLLRANSVLGLCLYCHGKDSPQVAVDGANRIPPQIEYTDETGVWPAGEYPSGGDFNHGNQSPENDPNRHDIGRTSMASVYPPGSDGTVNWDGVTTDFVTTKYGTTFTCLYCHDHHGNDNYRNLRYDPGNPTNDDSGSGVTVSYSVDAASCSDGGGLPCDVDMTTGANNRVKYYRSNVIFEVNTAARDYNRISEWCSKCHSKFFSESTPYTGASGGYLGGDSAAGVGLGDTDETNPWVRHPVGDVYVGITTNRHSVDNIGSADIRVVLDDTASNPQPFCLSCHYAHGGPNPNNPDYPELDHSILVKFDGTDNINFSSSYVEDSRDPFAAGYLNRGMMRNTCQKCHNQ